MSATRQLSQETLSQDLYRFAIELRQLAYTMPRRGGGPAYPVERADGAPSPAGGPPLDRSGSCVVLVIAPSLRDAVASRAETRHAIAIEV